MKSLTELTFKNIMCRRNYVSSVEGLHSPQKWRIPEGQYTGISVYNCILKTKIPLVIKNPRYAQWYMCGPTVYDSAHIGHASCYVKFDIIRRILAHYFNINAVTVMGITDIDDKIIARATKLKQDTKTLTNHYEAEFMRDMKNLNVMAPTVYTRVTDFVPSIISFVQKIIDKKQAYISQDGSVYFDTSTFGHYGKLFPVPLNDDNTPHPDKRSPLDFALWKGSKPGEPWWKSPWGPGGGRPGWHIECSVMASSVFGNNIDLHSGGIDLIFPHHENEEAQSCVHHGVDQWVNYWLHSGHLNLKGDEKMSKSLKNTITIAEFLENVTATQFRIFCLLSRYRNGVEYSDVTMKNAKGICKRIESFFGDCESYIHGMKPGGVINEAELLKVLVDTDKKVLASLSDDFDTARAMNAILELISTANKMLHQDDQPDSARSAGAIAAAALFVKQTLENFGAHFSSRMESSTAASSQQLDRILNTAVQFRAQVREISLQRLTNKNTQVHEIGFGDESILKECDTFRDELLSAGISVKEQEDIGA